MSRMDYYSFSSSSFLLFLFLTTLILFIQSIQADPIEEHKLALLDFANKLPHFRSLNWNKANNSTICNHWVGVVCNREKTQIVELHLPGFGFHGQIPPNTLTHLSSLQILSLRSNSITGPFPADFTKLKNLTFLYLQLNNFSGSLPFDFSAWKNLTVLNLSYNSFNGSIPTSISNLTRLTSLNLANNKLSGHIPIHLNLPNLKQLNLANNTLSGVLPESLKKFPSWAFVGNNISIAIPPPSPLLPAHVPSPDSQLPRNSRKLNQAALLGIIVGSICFIGFVGFAVLLVFCCLKRKNEIVGKIGKGDRSLEKGVTGSQDGNNNRLVFFQGCNYAFDLEDLLRASAEVLGKGTFGVAYKASLEDSTTVVVKRLKDVGVGKREFEQQMELVGRIQHENLVELRAYYYSRDEKLMVYDYYPRGSVSALLHGKRGEGRVPLDWDTRLRIAIGTARGLVCIHTENGKKLVHGNIKSSNIFINTENYGCVSDLGLSTLMSPVAPTISRTAGYRAPEVVDTRKSTQPSDVYSYGVLLLELLTGKSPILTLGGNEVIQLVRWVQSVVREEWTAEVFDIVLMRHPNIEEELVEMLQIALTCVMRMPDERPKMPEVMKMVENIRRMDTGNRPSSETKSESSTPPPPPPPPLEVETNSIQN